MKEKFWICSGCGSVNEFQGDSDRKCECAVCGKLISEAEEKKAMAECKKALKIEKSIKRREKTEKAVRKKEELKKERQTVQIKKQEKRAAARDKNKVKRNELFFKYRKCEGKFFDLLPPFMKISRRLLVVLVVVALAIVAFSVFSHGSVDMMLERSEKTVQRVVTDFVEENCYNCLKQETYVDVDEEGETHFSTESYVYHETKFLHKILERIAYIVKHFERSENIEKAKQVLGW